MPPMLGIVGRVVDAISAVDSSGIQPGISDLIGGAAGYDFAVANMAFRVHSTDETPYQRETAEFKKDQFDAGQVVGEQSLDGWWLRSQLSFHRGAGIRYYEILDGETSLNRYNTAVGIDPWEPGEVTLHDTFAAGEGASIIDAVPGTHAGNRGVFTLESDGDLVHRYAGGTTAFATSDAADATWITSNGSNLFATNGSKIEVQDADTTLAVLWTHTDVGTTWQGVWWAKGRLFAVDSNDAWYALSRAGGSVAAADAFWSPGTTPGEWTLTETPAFVILANGTDIYAVTLATDGSVPELTAPVVIAQVPVGETIKSLHYYLGYVVICTQVGLRIGQAELSDSTPVLVYGPLLIEGDFSACRRPAAFGSLVYAIGNVEDYDAATVFEINLEQQVSDLRPAWTARAELGGAVSTNQGCVFDANGVLWVFVNSQIRREDPTLAATGILETGLLRYGTLEPKLFQTVRVRVAGEGGTVAVERVLPDGATSGLYTINVSGQTEVDLGLGLNAPSEAIGLRFTLTSETGDASIRPTLLGYQVRALPSPRRQRMIRVPLLMMDIETDRRGVERGYEGRAWERLSMLETIESKQLLTQFADLRTMEVGFAVIESVTFQSDTPSKNASSGFGGVAYIELRKIG